MDFDDLLDRVQSLVDERGRVSLAAVGEYFDLTPQRLSAVRDELVDARGAVVLEDERILVSRRSAPDESSEAERRHLTVMFVDLVGSTDLSNRLDPEDLRELVRHYQQTVAMAVERFHGYIAQYLGDGVLVYFGYPHAHDDDPRRAVFAAHEVLARLPDLNARLRDRYQVGVDLRVGIHTGLVVVGDVGAGERHEALALGNVPNIAARLESLAEPSTIVLSQQTKRLLGDQFELENLGDHRLKGLADPVPVFRSLRPSGVASAFDLAVKHKLLPLAGRRHELGQLDAAWARAKDGQGSSLLLTGDPGIGKSRLIQALKDRLTDRDERWTALRASAYHTNSPLYPVVALLKQTIGIDERDPDAVNFMRIKAALEDLEVVSTNVANVIAALCDVRLPDDAAQGVDLRSASSMFEGLFMQFLLQGPRLLVVEDVHWLDPTTRLMTRRLMAAAPQHAMLVVVSARSGHDLSEMVAGLSNVARVRLAALPPEDVQTMIRSVAGKRQLSDDVVKAIAERTDGVPAFVEELSRMLLTSDWLVERDGVLVSDGPLPKRIPETLTDSLMARLDRLGDAKAVAQEAAVVGRTFSGAVLTAISEFDAARLDDALHTLAHEQIIRRRSRIGEENWRFRHALLQDAAYQSLLRARRQALHLRIAQTVEAEFQSLAAQNPERVAQHFQSGGEPIRALGYWQWAAEHAIEQGGTSEALAHVNEAMLLLEHLPDGELRDQRELALLSMKGSSMILIDGWAADGLADIYDRALELVSRGGHSTHVDFQVLGGLCAFHLVRGEMDTVELLAERLSQQGRSKGEPESLVVAHVCRCIAGFFGGHFDVAAREAEALAQVYDPNHSVAMSFLYGQDPTVIVQTLMAFMTYTQGDANAALALSDQVMRMAPPQPGRFNDLWASAWHARLQYEQGDFGAAAELSRHTWMACEELGFSYVGALARMVMGASQVARGDVESGIDHVRAAYAYHQASPSAMAHAYFNALAVACEVSAGRADQALFMVNGAIDAQQHHGIVAWRSELLRLRCELTWSEDAAAAAAGFSDALTEARAMGAHRLALRAAVAWLERDPGAKQARSALALSRPKVSDDRDTQRADHLLAKDAGAKDTDPEISTP